MGVDFIEKTSRTFERRRSRALEELRSQHLFDNATGVVRTYRARCMSDDPCLKTGEPCVLRLTDGEVHVYRGVHLLGVLTQPSINLIDAMACSSNLASGRIDRVSELTGDFDVILD